jgi:integrase
MDLNNFFPGGFTPEKIQELLTLLAKSLQPDPRDAVTLDQIIQAYLREAHNDMGPEALAFCRLYLGRLAKDLGHLPVSQLTPLHLKEWMALQIGWKSANTRHGVNSRVQRCLNWAVNMRQIRENPFRGTSFPQGDPQDEMTEEEYQALWNVADARFRRMLLFLRYTGCRPGEMRNVKWTDIDWKKGVICLQEHKTRKKTGKPRLIFLAPIVLDMLREMQAHPDTQQPKISREAAVEAIRQILAKGPFPAKVFHKKARAAGLPSQGIYRLARLAGARSHRVGGISGKGYEEWTLEETLLEGGIIQRRNRTGYYAKIWQNGKEVQVKLDDDLERAKEKLKELKAQEQRPAAYPPREAPRRLYQPDKEHVFLNHYGQPWRREALVVKFARLRERARIGPKPRLYGLRHKFGSDGICKGVNLKVLAELMGHASTAMTEHYILISGDVETMQQAMDRMFGGASPLNQQQPPTP